MARMKWEHQEKRKAKVIGTKDDDKNDLAARWLAKHDTPIARKVLTAIKKGTWKDWENNDEG